MATADTLQSRAANTCTDRSIRGSLNAYGDINNSEMLIKVICGNKKFKMVVILPSKIIKEMGVR